MGPAGVQPSGSGAAQPHRTTPGPRRDPAQEQAGGNYRGDSDGHPGIKPQRSAPGLAKSPPRQGRAGRITTATAANSEPPTRNAPRKAPTGRCARHRWAGGKPRRGGGDSLPQRQRCTPGPGWLAWPSRVGGWEGTPR
ncbi:hypothetical protein GCM10018785_13410 [Streptomyces longispororuber]|uniref:Uncharacterized protein n=1 Tax=Streptomyces longispororuber TaxID=68230 RepID=A0A919DHK5_9ACTN|nr:hypothetical protein GCM10018785_13410 [Streptomyces longispororuber]